MIHGAPGEPVGSINSVAAEEIQAEISKEIIANARIDGSPPTEISSRETIEQHVDRIKVRKNQLAVHMRSNAYGSESLSGDDDRFIDEQHLQNARTVIVPWKKPSKPAR